MATPIQIILNDRDYEEARDTGGGGPRKEFFESRDKQFQAHRTALIDQLEGIAQTIEQQPQGAVGYIKVILRRSAWAKSHRPLGVLFKPDRIPLVGGDDLGEMLFEARPVGLREIAQSMKKAEDATRWKKNKQDKDVPNPSAHRSEVGAIERIDIYSSQDRRRFSVDEAVAWLSNPMTGGSYNIELFDVPPPRNMWDAFDRGKQQLYTSFVEGLGMHGRGLTVQRLPTRDRAQPLLAVRLGRSAEPPILKLTTSPERAPSREIVPLDQSLERHRALLAFLDHHPLVRKIELPAIVVRTVNSELVGARSSSGGGRVKPTTATLPLHESTRSYPRIGIIDGGIGPELSDWTVGRWDLLDGGDVDLDHGTFISGLAVAGNALNGPEICGEPDGAELIDIGIFPNEKKAGAFTSYFPNGVSQFFDEIEYAVSDAHARHGVRIFNMSLNIQHQATPDRYSLHAARLDQIAENTDSILFISAGNTSPQDLRPEWPNDETQALVNLASARSDGILTPAESVRNVAIAAVNPPGLAQAIAFAPTRFSRRGPGLRAGVKPDLAHVGGTGSPQDPLGHGLFSVLPDGSVIDGCGTSYAAPLVAKTAAVLEHAIEGEVSRETLIGMLIHHAGMPALLRSKALSGVARDLVGFGIPPSANDMLEGSDHKITLVFASRIRKDQQINFRFVWPPSLVDATGKCRGEAKLTLASTPILDPRFGSEFVRINIEAALQQENFDKDQKPSWKGRLDPLYLPGKAESPIIEAERIEHGLKWSPIKVHARNMRGVGKSSNWRLFVSYLTRAA